MLPCHSCMENQDRMQSSRCHPGQNLHHHNLEFQSQLKHEHTKYSISDISFCNHWKYFWYLFLLLSFLSSYLCQIKSYNRDLYNGNLYNSTIAFCLTSQIDMQVSYSHTLKRTSTKGTNFALQVDPLHWRMKTSWMPASLTNENFGSTVFNFNGKSPCLVIKFSL